MFMVSAAENVCSRCGGAEGHSLLKREKFHWARWEVSAREAICETSRGDFEENCFCVHASVCVKEKESVDKFNHR